MNVIGRTDWTQPRLEQLLQRCLEKVDISGAVAVYLEGSIAEGFGNATSDVDFVVLRDVAGELPAMPTILFVDAQRVEIRSRSLAEMRRILTNVARYRDASRRHLLGLDETMLDRCQRFLHGKVLRGGAECAALRRLLPEPDLRAIVSCWFGAQAEEAVRCAVALGALGQEAEAVSWARSALTLGAKCWLASLGETYLAKKWISRQIARSAAADEKGARFLLLENPPRSGLAAADYILGVEDLLRDMGVHGYPAGADRVTLKRRQGVTTWQIGDRVHIVRNRRDVFALSVDAARIWRSLAFNRPLPGMLRVLAATPEAGRIIAEFHRLGLIDLRWKGAGAIRIRTISAIAPDPGRPILSVDGMCFPDERTPIRRASIPAGQFAAAGMSLVYANLVIENAREDALGAMGAGQWRVMERAGRAILRHASMAMLSAAGVHPVPPVEELQAALIAMGNIPSMLLAQLLELDRTLCIDNETSAQEALERLDALVCAIRDMTRTSLFPRCFSTAGAWQRAIDIGYDWIILGAYLDADFPLDEARDVIATGGQQPMAKEPTAGARRLED